MLQNLARLRRLQRKERLLPSLVLHEPTGMTIYNKVMYICAHPYIADIESPNLDQGHVVQMIAVPQGRSIWLKVFWKAGNQTY